MLVIHWVSAPRRKGKVGEKQDTRWELSKKGCTIGGCFSLSLSPQGATECTLRLRTCALAAMLGVCARAWESAGGSADVPSLPHSLLSAFLIKDHLVTSQR